VRRHAKQLHENYPEEVELLEPHRVETRDGAFSHIRLLGTSAAQELVSRIAGDVLNGKLENLSFPGLGALVPLRNAVLRFITKYHVDDQTCAEVKDFYGRSCLWKGLLLLRGLLAHGILIYVLRRQRWRVDYGLDLKRSLLAVPYRAKVFPQALTYPRLITMYYTGCPQLAERLWSSRRGRLPNVFKLLLRRTHSPPSARMLRPSL